MLIHADALFRAGGAMPAGLGELLNNDGRRRAGMPDLLRRWSCG